MTKKYQVILHGSIIFQSDDELVADRYRFLTKGSVLKTVYTTNLERACLLLGWQGGTVHQVAQETGLTVDEILNAENIDTLIKEKQCNE